MKVGLPVLNTLPPLPAWIPYSYLPRPLCIPTFLVTYECQHLHLPLPGYQQSFDSYQTTALRTCLCRECTDNRGRNSDLPELKNSKHFEIVLGFGFSFKQVTLQVFKHVTYHR